MDASVREKRYAAYRDYKRQGHTMQEVADKFGISRGTAQQVCRGIAPQHAKTYTKRKTKSDCEVDRLVSERVPQFEYVGGYTNGMGSVQLRCKKCGHVQLRSVVSVRHGSTTCDNCKRISIEKNAEQKEIERERKAQKRQEKAEEKIRARREWELARKHRCPVCGAETIRMKYCSDECARKAANNTHDAQRRAKIKNALIDSDIELHALYERDGGVCHICGGLCMWEDSVEVNGTVVCGDGYPSVDHIVPLAKGGMHSWDNVKLAHRRCNTIKRDKILPLPFGISG